MGVQMCVTQCLYVFLVFFKVFLFLFILSYSSLFLFIIINYYYFGCLFVLKWERKMVWIGVSVEVVRLWEGLAELKL